MSEKEESKFLNIIKKGLLGILIGEFIATLIPIIISLIIGDGNYYPLVPQFAETCKTEIGGIVLQFILSGILGACIGISTIVWKCERLSLVAQTFIHFAIMLASMFPVAWICHWMSHTIGGVIRYSVIFLTIYILIAIIMYLLESNKIKKINARLKN